MAAVLQLGKLPEMVDERQPGITMDHERSIHMMAAAQLTVLAIVLQPGHQKLLPILAARMALLQDPRLPRMVAMMAGAPKRLLTKATAVLRITNGAAIPLQEAGPVAPSKTTHHTMLLLLARTSQLLHPQQ
jgi:hypothetical protein